MNYIDYIIFAAVIVGFILGFKDGLVRKIIGIIGLIAGFFLAFNFAGDLGSILAPLLDDEIYLAEIFGGFLIFIITLLLFAILKRVIHPFDKVNKLVNQLLGGMAGVIQIVFFISGFLLFLNLFGIPAEKSRNDSILYSSAYQIIPSTVDLILGSNYKTQNLIEDFIESETDTLNNSGNLTE